MKKLLLALSALLVVSFVSCTKEEDELDIDVSKPSYLVNNYWKVTEVEVNPDFENENSFLSSVYQNLPLCFRDNIYDFTTSTTLTIDESHVKCDANHPQLSYFHYLVSNNDKSLMIYTNPEDPGASTWFNGEITTINVEKFTTTEFKTIGNKIQQTVTTYEIDKKKNK